MILYDIEINRLQPENSFFFPGWYLSMVLSLSRIFEREAAVLRFLQHLAFSFVILAILKNFCIYWTPLLANVAFEFGCLTDFSSERF